MTIRAGPTLMPMFYTPSDFFSLSFKPLPSDNTSSEKWFASFRKASIDMDKGEPFGCFELNFFVFNVRFSFFLFVESKMCIWGPTFSVKKNHYVIGCLSLMLHYLKLWKQMIHFHTRLKGWKVSMQQMTLLSICLFFFVDDVYNFAFFSSLLLCEI